MGNSPLVASLAELTGSNSVVRFFLGSFCGTVKKKVAFISDLKNVGTAVVQ